MVSKNKTRNNILAFILGFLTVNNVLYLFVVGDTPILMAYVFGTYFILLYLLISIKKVIYNTTTTPKLLVLFFSWILFSSIQTIVYRGSMSVWLSGIIELILVMTIMYSTMILEDRYAYIVKGIIFGVQINFIIVIFEEVLDTLGLTFILNEAIPVLKPFTELLYIGSVGRGLFAEPGHLMRSITILFFIIYPQVRKYKLLNRILVYILFAIIAMTSGSASFIYFILGIILLYIWSSGKNVSKWMKGILITMIILLVLAICATFIPFLNNITTVALKSFFDIFNSSDVSNSIRIQGMLNALKVIQEYPIFGCGWNQFATHFEKFGFLSHYVRGSYSYALELFAEIGIGAFFYFGFIILNIIRMKKRSDNIFDISFTIALIMYLLVCITTDFSFDPSIALLLGIVSKREQQIRLANKTCK